MGESLIESIIQEFGLKENDIRSYSPLTFAYIGDSIYALLAKSVVVARGNVSAERLHNETVKYVSATSQAVIYNYLTENGLLSETEEDILRRGRNAKPQHSAKNASAQDYRLATGLEALFGWLYLKGETERLTELMKLAVSYIDREK